MRTLLMVAATAFAACSAVPAFAQAVVPVQFARGASSSVVNGSIKGDVFTDYRIVVRQGQMLTVSLTTVAGSAYFNVMEPGSRDVAIYNSSLDGQKYSGQTMRSGAYTIRVYQMRSNGRRGETARFRLSVAVAGGSANARPDVPSHRPGDALVPGTPYHATATVKCRSAAGAAMGTCNAGVIRRNGSATVHLDTPDGGERSILFRGGTAVSSDSQARLSVSRQSDVSVVRIGTVEVYEIPDALVEGG